MVGLVPNIGRSVSKNQGENMKDPEDEAFEELNRRQGDWGLQGSRKHQIIRYAENNARNEVIEEVAQHIEKCTLAFGKDTIQSFTAYVRGMKK
jgi:hypothetical protein